MSVGHWIHKVHYIGSCSAVCSVCGHVIGGKAIDTGYGYDYSFPEYCSHCGSEMTDLSDEEDIWTMGDSIRSMDDEQLADFIVTIITNAFMKAGWDQDLLGKCQKATRDDWLKWLKGE